MGLVQFGGLMVMGAGAVKYGLVQGDGFVVFGESPRGLAEGNGQTDSLLCFELSGA